MTNFEKYKDEITQLTNEHKRIAFMNGKIVSCSDIDDCTICKFGNPRDSCHFLIVKWLCEEYTEPIKLTHKQLAILKILETGWLARDDVVSKTLYWYSKKPKRGSCTFEIESNIGVMERIQGFFDVFDFIKWEDEPYSVEEMLRWDEE